MTWVWRIRDRIVRRGTKPGPRRRGSRSVLLAIAVMLGLSGLLRLGSEAGSAFASGSVPVVHEAAAPDLAQCNTADDIAVVLAVLDEREVRVAQRESDLDARVQALSVAESQVARNLTALEEAEARLSATMARASTAAEEDLERLTSVYENMKPKQAAPVFAAMDPEFAAGFLGRMRPDVSAAIMAGLEPEVAYAISALLAGRNADAPTE